MSSSEPSSPSTTYHAPLARPRAPSPPSRSPSVLLPAISPPSPTASPSSPSQHSTSTPYRTPHHSLSASDVSQISLDAFVWNPTSAIHSPNPSPHRQRVVERPSAQKVQTPPRISQSGMSYSTPMSMSASTSSNATRIRFPKLMMDKTPKGFPYADTTVLDGSPASVERWRREGGTQEGDEDVDLDFTGEVPGLSFSNSVGPTPKKRPSVIGVRLTYGEEDLSDPRSSTRLVFEEEEVGRLRSFVFPSGGSEEERSRSAPTTPGWMEGRERVQSQTSSMGVGMASGMGMGMAGFSMDESSHREREEAEEEGWVYAPTAPISPSALAMSVDSEDEGGTFGRARGKKEKEKLNRRSGTWTIGSFFNSSQHLVSPRSSRLMNPPLTPTRPSTGDRPKPPSPASSTQTPLSPLFSSPDAGDSVFSSLPASPEFRGMQVNPKGRGSGTPGTSNWGSFGSIFGIPWLGRSALSPSNPSTPPSMSMSMDVDGHGGRRGQHVSYSVDEEEHRRRRWEKSPAASVGLGVSMRTRVDSDASRSDVNLLESRRGSNAKPHVGVRFEDLVEVEKRLVEGRGFTMIGMDDIDSLPESGIAGDGNRPGSLYSQRVRESASKLRRRSNSVKISIPNEGSRLSIAEYLQRSESRMSVAGSDEEGNVEKKSERERGLLKKKKQQRSRKLLKRMWKWKWREDKETDWGLLDRLEDEGNIPALCFYLGFFFPWFWLLGALYLRPSDGALPDFRSRSKPYLIPATTENQKPKVNGYVLACRIASAIATCCFATLIIVLCLVGTKHI